MKSEIKITAAAHVVTIDIDGIIGVPEQTQFDSPDDKVATYERFENALRSISSISADRVVVNIRSTGGDVGDALLIYDALRELNVEVTTRCSGYVASAATVIAQAASKGCREISSNSLYLIHCCESTCDGNAQSLSAVKELLDKSDARIAEIYAEASGRAVEGFVELMNRNGGKGRWLSPKEAVAAGLVDRIVESAPVTDEVATMAVEAGLPPLPHRGVLRQAVAKLQSVLRLLSGSDEAPSTDTTPANSTTLHSRTVEQPALSARMLSARPTETALREDPSIGEPQPSVNRSAYDNDIENIKRQ